MVLRVGDTLFNRDGQPGIVSQRDPKKQTLEVAEAGPAYEKGRKYGFINGLEPGQRKEFESIIDDMKTRTEARDRVNFLHGEIEKVKEDPKRNVLAHYLEGEMAHIMNSENVAPRVYRIDETKT